MTLRMPMLAWSSPGPPFILCPRCFLRVPHLVGHMCFLNNKPFPPGVKWKAKGSRIVLIK